MFLLSSKFITLLKYDSLTSLLIKNAPSNLFIRNFRVYVIKIDFF